MELSDKLVHFIYYHHSFEEIVEWNTLWGPSEIEKVNNSNRHFNTDELKELKEGFDTLDDLFS